MRLVNPKIGFCQFNTSHTFREKLNFPVGIPKTWTDLNLEVRTSLNISRLFFSVGHCAFFDVE